MAVRNNQHQFSINVWAGIVENNIIIYLFPHRLNGIVYLNFLREILPGLLENVPLAVLQNMWYQHDGAPAHFTLDVRNYLNQVFPNRWIGCGGPIDWPS